MKLSVHLVRVILLEYFRCFQHYIQTAIETKSTVGITNSFVKFPLASVTEAHLK